MEVGSVVTSLPAYLFYSSNADYYANLKSVSFSGTQLTTIGKYAFYYCTELESLNLPEGLKYIYNCAFYNCKNMTKLYIPTTVKEIKEQAFSYTSALRELNFYAIECADFSSSGTFHNAGQEDDGLTVNFGPKLKKIPAYFFYTPYADNYVNLTECNFEGIDITSIGKYAFTNCKYLTTIDILENMIFIGQEAFKNCSSLESANFAIQYLWYAGRNTELEYLFDEHEAALYLTTSYHGYDIWRQE